MHRKLQYNFDVIQFLIKNASPEQLTWRDNEKDGSLAEIICCLRDLEWRHVCFLIPDMFAPDQTVRSPVETDQGNLVANYQQAFVEYAYYRQKIIDHLQKLSQAQWQPGVIHQQFDQVNVMELVEQMDQQDQIYIKRIEEIIRLMPLNPLLARALHEIRDYHRRYQAHLAQATSLLDIGVGTGLALRHIMQENPHLTVAGVDVRDLRLPDINVPLQVYEGKWLPFAADQFDVSLLFYVLHHCQAPQHLLDEAVRVTRQKLIIIEEFDRPEADPTSLDLTERQNHRALGLPPDLPYQLFGKAELEAMFKVCTLTELEQRPLPSKTARPVQKYLYVLGL